MAVTGADASPSIAERLHNVRVGTRQDLTVTRHLFRDVPVYVVCDPLTFASHRLETREYTVFTAISPERTLSEIHAELAERGLVDADDPETFYQFVMTLHRFNFLNLPISSEKILYERYAARKQSERRRRWTSLLSLKIPLINPDEFLNRTMRYAQFLFKGWFFTFWLILVAASLYIAAVRSDELFQPLEGVLLARNLPLLWFVLIVLKIIHEFGHAYACKHYGGYVPEMGALLIVMTPVAYVDASSSWSFTSKRQRIVVALAGMYVEGTLAAIAILVWASSPPGVVRDLAYNVVFLAGVITIGFNINPLMRYDGYHIFSDLVGIPNLRTHAVRRVSMAMKRIFLGIRVEAKPISRRMWAFFMSFGLAASVYRVLILVGIAMLLASRFHTAGLIVGVAILGKFAITAVVGLGKYLWMSNETELVRGRCAAVAVAAIVVAPGLILLAPIRPSVVAAGVVSREVEATVRAGDAGGFVTQILFRPGDRVDVGKLLVKLTDDDAADALREAQTYVEASDIRHNAYQVEDPAEAAQELERGRVRKLYWQQRRSEMDRLAVRSPIAGMILEGLQPRDRGRFVAPGEMLARVGDGRWRVRAVVTEEQLVDASLDVGARVRVRVASDSAADIEGTVFSISEQGSRLMELDALTADGGGEIPVDRMSRQAQRAYVEVVIDLDSEHTDHLRSGMTCRVRFTGPAATLGQSLWRRLLRFTDSVTQS